MFVRGDSAGPQTLVHRPGYPAELFDLVMAYAGQPVRTALEIGAGTGKATRLLAARGVSILGIEPSAEMAAYARAATVATGNVEIIESDFERWRPGGRTFPLVWTGTLPFSSRQ